MVFFCLAAGVMLWFNGHCPDGASGLLTYALAGAVGGACLKGLVRDSMRGLFR